MSGSVMACASTGQDGGVLIDAHYCSGWILAEPWLQCEAAASLGRFPFRNASVTCFLSVRVGAVRKNLHLA
jgi:hypothetical protein